MKIIGISERKTYKFDDGRTSTGFQLFVTSERDDVKGLACERLSLNERAMASLVELVQGVAERIIGLDVEVLYNRWGKPERFLLAEPSKARK